MIRLTCLWFLTCVAVPQFAWACSAGAPGCPPAEMVIVPQTHAPLPPRTLPGYTPGTGATVLDQGFGRYRSETGVTMRDNGLGRIEGGGERLRYQGTQPLRTQTRKSCRVRPTGTVICF